MHGANIHEQDKGGRTAIQIAHVCGHAKFVKLLIESGGADESSLQAEV